MAVSIKNPAFMTGVPELLVLKLLAGREMYGYEIARAVKSTTNDGLNLGEGVLYPALHALERRGLFALSHREFRGPVSNLLCSDLAGRKAANALDSRLAANEFERQFDHGICGP